MKRDEMIKDKKRFNYIIRKGRYNKDKNFVIYYVPSLEEDKIHFGIAVKNSLGCAVVRNRVKRQTRSVIDKNKKLFKNGQDYIIMIREGCIGNNFASMNASLTEILKGIK